MKRAQTLRSRRSQIQTALGSGLVLISNLGCAHLQSWVKQPEVEFRTARYVTADFDALRVDIDLAVTNPNPLGVAVEGYDVRFEVDGLTLLDGTVNQKIDLRGGKTSVVTLPVNVPWTKLARKLSDGIRLPATLPWTSEGKIYVDSPAGRIGLPFDVSGQLPVIKPPSISLENLSVSDFGLTSVTLDLNFEIKNATGHRFGLADFAHRVELGGRQIVTGSLAAFQVPQHGKKNQRLRTKVALLKLGTSLVAALRGKGTLPIRLAGATHVDTGFGAVPFDFNVSKKLKVQ